MIYRPTVDQIVSIEKAEADGLEVEFAALVTDGLTISGALGYLDTEVKSDTIVQLSGGWRPSLLGLDLPKSPELTANLMGEYRWPIGGDNEAWGYAWNTFTGMGSIPIWKA